MCRGGLQAAVGGLKPAPTHARGQSQTRRDARLLQRHRCVREVPLSVDTRAVSRLRSVRPSHFRFSATYTREGPDRVRQILESSSDGKSWAKTYEGLYIRR